MSCGDNMMVILCQDVRGHDDGNSMASKYRGKMARGQRAVSPQLSITLVWAGCVLAAVISEESVNININKY